MRCPALPRAFQDPPACRSESQSLSLGTQPVTGAPDNPTEPTDQVEILLEYCGAGQEGQGAEAKY